MYAGTLKYRLLARVTAEAKTPVKVSAGEKGFESDSYVSRDVNGLPYLPGTSLTGVFRRLFDEETASSVFGFQEDAGGMGSRIITTDGCLCNQDSFPVEGILPEMDPFLQGYTALPIREHVRINGKGVAEAGGKFDEQIVFKGSRFCFEICLLSEGKDEISILDTILGAIRNGDVRIGGGTRNGFGLLSIWSAQVAVLDLEKEEDLILFLKKPSSLRESASWAGWQTWTRVGEKTPLWEDYELDLSPQHFFLFSSGFQSEDGNADFSPVEEMVVVWDSGKGEWVKRHLIPATSLKGALAHRIAYHYNKLTGIFAEDVDPEEYSGVRNQAVRRLFGYVDETEKKASRGRVLFEDFYFEPGPKKILNHLSVDPFSGGARSGALFNEQVDTMAQGEILLRIRVSKDALEDETVRRALELSLTDLKEGRLPLGGGVNRGHGQFMRK